MMRQLQLQLRSYIVTELQIRRNGVTIYGQSAICLREVGPARSPPNGAEGCQAIAF